MKPERITRELSKLQLCHHHQNPYQMKRPMFYSRIFVNIVAFNTLLVCITMLAIAQDSSQSNPSELNTRSQLENIRKFFKRDTDDLEPNPGPEPSESDLDSPENYAAANSDSDSNYQGSATGGGEESNAGGPVAVSDESNGELDSTDATDLQAVHASISGSRAEFAGNSRHANTNHGSIRSQDKEPVIEPMRVHNQNQLLSTTQHHQVQPQANRTPQSQFGHSTTSSNSVTSVRRNADRTNMNLPPSTTMMPMMRFGQSTSHQQSNNNQQARQPRPQLTSKTEEMRPSIPPSAFNVDMGADRMLIKPIQPSQQQQQQQREQQQLPRSTTMSSTNMATLANIMDQEMATETINHELLSQNNDVHHGGVTMLHPSNLNGSNQRRQDLLYPTRFDDSNTRHSINSFEGKSVSTNNYLNDLQPQEASQLQVPSICYTPLALLIVILVTMMITIVVCFCTHIVIRYLSRHQFDLVESSKQFDSKHGSSSSAGRPLEDASEQRTIQTQQGSTAILFNSSSNINSATDQLGDEETSNNKQSCMLSLFRGDQTVSPDSKTLQRMREEHGFAFDNPYFRDEASNQRYLRHPHLQHLQQQPHHQQTNSIHHASGGGIAGLLQTAINEDLVGNGRAKVRLGDNGMVQQHLAGNEQLHFIEHHISNLHNRQVTSSVKELSILGSPENQNVADVVDLTSDEQRSRIIADPKEGDLVAVDITGHDIIGLGFDICGNQHDGVFIKSVFSRGPARESGCIESGDRIKCLNISFDNITLQDACDILNCGSPYKMRILLEKRAAPPKFTEKLSKSPAPRALYYGSQLELIPNGSSSGISISRGQNNNQQLANASSGGVLNTTKSYFRLLANLISPNDKRARINQHLDYRNRHDFGISSANINNELLVNAQAQYLGSAAARRQLFSGGVLQLTSDQSNSDTQTTIPHQVANPTTFDEARVTSRAPITSSLSAQKRFLPQSGSIDSNLRGRFSVDSEADMLNVGSSTNDFNADSSLDYQNRNANHRLHGPQFENRVGQRIQAEDITGDLRMVASQNQLNSHSRSTATAARRQSVACVMQTSGSGSIKVNSKDLSSSNRLEQTQSQPEITLRESGRGHEEVTPMSRQRSEDALVDERIEILPNSRSNNPSTVQDTRNGRFQMIGSVSTPSVNLLGSSNHQQQPDSASAMNNSSNDWRKAPSLRRKKQQQELKESIREETGGGSDSSYADSTSRLVEKKQEQSKTMDTNLNVSRANSASRCNIYQRDTDNSRPTVTQLARNLESRAETLASSSATPANNSRDALTSLINRNKTSRTERDDRD